MREGIIEVKCAKITYKLNLNKNAYFSAKLCICLACKDKSQNASVKLLHTIPRIAMKSFSMALKFSHD